MSHKPGPYNLEKEEKFDEAFWVEYYPKLQRYCHFLTQNTWDGDDIAQETYFKALKYFPHQQKISSALLNKIAYHSWIDLLRKRKNETIEENPEANEVINHRIEDLSASVELLLKRLTPKQAVIFLLKEAFQYQAKEIADILATTEMAVKSTLHRAKRRIEKENEAEIFWDEEEKEQLSELFYETLKTQDPTFLIQFLSSTARIIEVPKCMVTSHSPSSTLCMAA